MEEDKSKSNPEEANTSTLTAPQKKLMEMLQNGKNVLIAGFTGTGKSYVVKKYLKTVPPEKQKNILVIDNVQVIKGKHIEKLKEFQGQRIVIMSWFDEDGDPAPPNMSYLKNMKLYECFEKIVVLRRPYLRDRDIECHWDASSDEED